jgi:hypothetical protein
MNGHTYAVGLDVAGRRKCACHGKKVSIKALDLFFAIVAHPSPKNKSDTFLVASCILQL